MLNEGNVEWVELNDGNAKWRECVMFNGGVVNGGRRGAE